MRDAPTLLILGGTGFVGGHLLNALARAGYRARVLSRNPTIAADARVAPGVELRPADVYDVDQVARQLDGCVGLINLIGILNERGRDGSGFLRAHRDSTVTAIQACERAGVRRFLQMSALNAGRGDSHYQYSKGEAEKALEASTLDWSIIQPSVIFGPGDSFINRFAGVLRLTPGFLPLACPDSRLQPVYIGDVTRSFVACLETPDSVGQRYQLGGPRIYTLKELVEYTARVAGLKRWIIGLPNWASRLQAAIMDFVPGKPFSTDNYRNLQLDSVVEDDGLARLGIAATALEAVVPSYLGAGTRAGRYQRYRRSAGR